jgi:hypothetical protein
MPARISESEPFLSVLSSLRPIKRAKKKKDVTLQKKAQQTPHPEVSFGTE